jgi:hypothetical protein
MKNSTIKQFPGHTNPPPPPTHMTPRTICEDLVVAVETAIGKMGNPPSEIALNPNTIERISKSFTGNIVMDESTFLGIPINTVIFVQENEFMLIYHSKDVKI